MSLPEDDNAQRALKREWAAARIVVLGGFVMAIAVAGYFGYRAYQQQRAAQQASIVHTTVVPRIDAKSLHDIEVAVCSAEVSRAKEIGIVPVYGVLASPILMRTNVQRRFICQAQTHLTRYFISADFLCDKLDAAIHDPRCVSVYRIVTRDGKLIYVRPE